MMHIDCYDRRILTFVLDRHVVPLPEQECRNWFGISPRAVLRRFDAVVDVYESHHVPLEKSDLALLHQAAQYRSPSR